MMASKVAFKGWMCRYRYKYPVDTPYYAEGHEQIRPPDTWSEWSYKHGRSASTNPMIYTTKGKALSGQIEGLSETGYWNGTNYEKGGGVIETQGFPVNVMDVGDE